MNIHRKNLLFICLIFVIKTNFFGQNQIIDSLKNKLKTHTKKDTLRVEILNNLAFYHYRNYPEQGLNYAKEAEKMAIEINSVKGIARSHYMRGVIFMEHSKYKVAINHYNKAIEMFSVINDQKRIAGCKNALGVLYQYQGNFLEALKNYKEALGIDQKLGIEKNKANYLYNIGNILSDTGDHNKALVNFKKGLEIYKKDKNQYGIISCLNAIAIIYVEEGNYPLGLKYHNQSLEIAEKSNDMAAVFQSLTNMGHLYNLQEQYEKALHFYNRALHIKNQSKNTRNVLALKINIGAVHLDKNDYTIALTKFKEILKISRQLEDNNSLVVALTGLGYSYDGLNKHSLAKEMFKEAIEISKTYKNQHELINAYIGLGKVYYNVLDYENALNITSKANKLAKKFQFLVLEKKSYKLLSLIKSNLGNYQDALVDYKNYKKLSDSIFNKKNIEKIAEIEYENKFKGQLKAAEDREEKLSETVETTSKNLERSKQNILFGVIIFLILTILLGSFIFYLKLKNEKTKTQNIIVEQKLLRSQMTPHFIFNSLSVLQGMILEKKERKSISYLSKFSKLLRIVLENSRNKIVLLSQELIAVENYLALQNLKNESYFYNIEIAENINSELFQIPPMLIQPFVENAIEHAFKNTLGEKIINIKITYKNKELICEIIDNGIGINTKNESNNSNKQSLSTSITSERLEMLSKDFKTKGSLLIEDRKEYNENGTIITIKIPYLLS